MDIKTLTRHYRIVIVRHGVRGGRWQWSVESKLTPGSEWEGEEVGFAWTLAGAERLARTNCDDYGAIIRREIVIVSERTYEPRDRPDPVKSELLT